MCYLQLNFELLKSSTAGSLHLPYHFLPALSLPTGFPGFSANLFIVHGLSCFSDRTLGFLCPFQSFVPHQWHITSATSAAAGLPWPGHARGDASEDADMLIPDFSNPSESATPAGPEPTGAYTSQPDITPVFSTLEPIALTKPLHLSLSTTPSMAMIARFIPSLFKLWNPQSRTSTQRELGSSRKLELMALRRAMIRSISSSNCLDIKARPTTSRIIGAPSMMFPCATPILRTSGTSTRILLLFHLLRPVHRLTSFSPIDTGGRSMEQALWRGWSLQCRKPGG